VAGTAHHPLRRRDVRKDLERFIGAAATTLLMKATILAVVVMRPKKGPIWSAL
jgi:hypothetical protein